MCIVRSSKYFSMSLDDCGSSTVNPLGNVVEEFREHVHDAVIHTTRLVLTSFDHGSVGQLVAFVVSYDHVHASVAFCVPVATRAVVFEESGLRSLAWLLVLQE